MAAQGHNRTFGDVGSMSGLLESGHDWAIYEYATERGNLVVSPSPKSPPAKCRDPSAAAQSPTAAARSNCSPHAATAAPRRLGWRTASRLIRWSSLFAPGSRRQQPSASPD
jgi:hypothetical protein